MRKPAPNGELSELIATIYEAATDPQRWPDFLRALARAVGSDQALMLHGERHGAPSQELITVGLDLDVIARWNGCREHVDIWLQHVFEVPVNAAYFSTDLVRPDVLHRSGFHSDILQPLDIEYSLGGVTENDTRRAGFFAVYRSARRGPYTEGEKHLYSLLVPHVGRALAVGRQLALAKGQRAATQGALDALATGVFLLDQAGVVIVANKAGQDILDASDGLSHRRDGLRGNYRDEDAVLQRLIRDAVATGVGAGVSSGGVTKLSRPSLRRPLVAVVSPLRNQIPFLGRERAAAVVFVRDPERQPEAPVDVLRRLWSLTPAEAKVGHELVIGHNINEIAQLLGLANDTVRKHVKQILSKTGTRRQSELVALILCALMAVQQPGD